MAQLLEVGIRQTTALRQPSFGSEELFHLPELSLSPLERSTRIHEQLVLAVNGSTGTRRFSEYDLRVQLYAHGGRWRGATHRLCTSLQAEPEQELRRCRAGSGRFEAAVWVLVPGNRPKMAATGPPLSTGLAEMQASMLGIDVCRLGLPPAVAPGLCNASSSGTVVDLMLSPELRRVVKTDMFRDDWLPLGSAFALAARTLPQPFTVVESGNFCGGATIFLALLRRFLAKYQPVACHGGPF